MTEKRDEKREAAEKRAAAAKSDARAVERETDQRGYVERTDG